MLSLSAHPFFLLRRPVLSLDDLEAFHTRCQDADRFGAEIQELLRQPFFQAAISLASPDLYENYLAWQKGAYRGDADKLLQALYRYLVRMSTRCTPFGLFAGVHVGSVESSTRFQFGDIPESVQKARLDMNYVAELTEHLLGDRHIRQQLRYYPNSILYAVGDSYRYVESYTKDKKRHYMLAAVGKTSYLDIVLRKAAAGALPGELAALLVTDQITAEEAEDYIDQLITHQLLVSEIEPLVTGDDMLERLIDRLRTLKGTDTYVSTLRRVESLLREPIRSPAHFEAIVAPIEACFRRPSKKDLVQVDLTLSATVCQLSHRVTNLLTDELSEFAFLGKAYTNSYLEQFKKRFYQRYEEREVPLLTALDSELGIGYGRAVAGGADHLPLLDDVAFGRTARPASTDWDYVEKLRFRLYETAIRQKSKCVAVTEEDIQEAKTLTNPSLPASLFVLGNLMAPSQETIDEGNFTFAVRSISGPSAAFLLGRFCHDPVLNERLQQALREEEQSVPDAIHAEIAHLPEARAGNILLRPALRDYEIPFLAGSSLPPERQIPLSDLMVSVPNGQQVVLRSKKLNKRVIPRLSAAHNFSRGLSHYRFLCDLQLQSAACDCNWSWGMMADQPFLPRVQYRHLIVSRAIWNLAPDDFQDLIDGASDPFTVVGNLRRRWQLPEQVVIVEEGDNELLVDFRYVVSCRLLYDRMKRKKRIRLTEFLLGQNNQFLSDNRGHSFANEIVIPLKHNVAAPPAATFPSSGKGVARSFAPGSEWLYVKIFTGPRMADRLLTEVIGPLAEELYRESLIDQWFFVRYNDPSEHLRIRFHGNGDPAFWQVVLVKLHASLADRLTAGLVHSLQIDTYQREIERYSAAAMPLSEQIFHIDSVAVVCLLRLLYGDNQEKYRWLFAMRGVDDLLSAFGCDDEAKLRLMTRLTDAYFDEFGGKTALRVSLNTKYRAHQSFIRTHMDRSQDVHHRIQPGADIFSERACRLNQVAIQIKEIVKSGSSHRSPSQLLVSYVHMFLNRMFVAKPREQELVVYHFLTRFYQYRVATRPQAAVP